MTEKANVYELYEKNQQTFMTKARQFVVTYFPYLMLVGNIIFEVLTRLFTIEFVDPFSPEFWTTLFVNTTSSTISYACFMYYAEKKRKNDDIGYKANCISWGKTSAFVRINHFEDFMAYCKEEHKKEVEEYRESLILNYTKLSIEEWNKEYRSLSPHEIDAMEFVGDLTRKEAKYIIKANGTINIKPIDPLLILAGIKVNSVNDAGRSNVNSTTSILARPVLCAVSCIFFSMFAGTFIGVSDASVWFDMLYTAGLIVTSSFIGYSKGISNADRHHNEIKNRIVFLERFEKHINDFTKEESKATELIEFPELEKIEA